MLGKGTEAPGWDGSGRLAKADTDGDGHCEIAVSA